MRFPEIKTIGTTKIRITEVERLEPPQFDSEERVMAKKKTIPQCIKGIEKHMKQIAKDRDALDVAIGEMKMLKECCDVAYDSLMDARDSLSELV